MHDYLYILGVVAMAAASHAQILNAQQITAVKARLAEGATHSWEIGTQSEALLELDTPSFSVFTAPVPPISPAPRSLNEVLIIADRVLAQQSTTGTGSAVSLFPGDVSAADPASVGIAVLLAGWTGERGHEYSAAATSERNYLIEVAPRTPDGAISHRAAQVQLWSDFVYMVPPFLAYYGAITESSSDVDEAFNQIKLYRDYLRDNSASGLWKHILLGESGNDEGHWSTGNALVAAGMVRVFATYTQSSWYLATAGRRAELINWITDIHAAMYAHQHSSGLFHNYADDRSTFLDAASAALLASTVYRLASLTGIETFIAQAERTREGLFAPNPNGSFAHFDADFWLKPVGNPYNYAAPGSRSPEAQAFVIELQAAYRDWAGLS
ncbi:hypothetical protein PUNSTDRAFT_68092 [Punctularia strigosozonata HHB-11173 SS5]|uniref:uncharacterized protein n=1 Tax=Punctularia strigosozonata (strain HHB-11173) TaxID=741275 RepID=UPI000441689E|nr:uncharacterized protein PUNSTDRAFT_68092 [Punctularia strigosozonata HHB-11173 SS5]EIN09188.1 hypothetical protein PUNSTDRAFT_68092 [Punctularia strigosozonata HHB-11173 SS5]